MRGVRPADHIHLTLSSELRQILALPASLVVRLLDASDHLSLNSKFVQVLTSSCNLSELVHYPRHRQSQPLYRRYESIKSTSLTSVHSTRLFATNNGNLMRITVRYFFFFFKKKTLRIFIGDLHEGLQSENRLSYRVNNKQISQLLKLLTCRQHGYKRVAHDVYTQLKREAYTFKDHIDQNPY